MKKEHIKELKRINEKIDDTSTMLLSLLFDREDLYNKALPVESRKHYVYLNEVGIEMVFDFEANEQKLTAGGR